MPGAKTGSHGAHLAGGCHMVFALPQAKRVAYTDWHTKKKASLLQPSRRLSDRGNQASLCKSRYCSSPSHLHLLFVEVCHRLAPFIRHSVDIILRRKFAPQTWGASWSGGCGRRGGSLLSGRSSGLLLLLRMGRPAPPAAATLPPVLQRHAPGGIGVIVAPWPRKILLERICREVARLHT